MSSKVCFRCLQRKPLDEFYRHAAMSDGRLNKCIVCTREDARQNRLANLEKVRAYDRARGSQPHRVAARAAYAKSPEAKLSIARSKKKWGVAHAIRRRAATAVGNAIRDGRLQRLPCIVCGSKADAHHPDYSAPLSVVWLCRKHHAQVHREHREWMRAA